MESVKSDVYYFKKKTTLLFRHDQILEITCLNQIFIIRDFWIDLD